MYLAQQFERDVRAILWTADYHGWINEIILTAEQRRRFKDFDGFIDESTCGLLLQKLRDTGTIASKRAWRTFNKACEHRNALAHSFLVEHVGVQAATEGERTVIRQLRRITADLVTAVAFSRILREQVEAMSDQDHEVSRQMMKSLADIDDYEAPNRKFATRQRTPLATTRPSATKGAASKGKRLSESSRPGFRKSGDSTAPA